MLSNGQLQSFLYSAFDTDPAPITTFVLWLAEDYGLPRKLHVLDMGCGPGKMLKEFADVGWTVTGMEPDSDFYKWAVENSQDEPHVDVRKGGFSELTESGVFDLITAINDPFHYLLEIGERVDALQRLFRALKPGGVLFLEMTNFLHKLRYYDAITEEISDFGGRRVSHVMQNEVDFHRACWIHRDEYLIEGQSEVIQKNHCLAMIPLPEMLYFLEQTGFTRIQTFNTFESLDNEEITGKYMLIAAQKPG